MSSGNSQGWSGDLHARANHVAIVDGIAQSHVGVALGAHISDCRKAGQQRQSGVLCTDESGAGSGDSQRFVATAPR